MRNEAMTIGVTPSQAAKQRWLNSFAMTAFYTYIDRIGDSLKKAGKDKTDKSIREAIREYKNLITRVRDKDCVKNRVKRAKIVRFTLC